MMKLYRRVGEKICIGEDIVLVVLDATAEQVEIGISAPRAIAIDREEVRLKKRGRWKTQQRPWAGK